MKNRFTPYHLLFSLFLFFLRFSLFGQLSEGGIPHSSLFNLTSDETIVTNLASPRLHQVEIEDSLSPLPYRYGVFIPADCSPSNSGKWEVTKDNGRIWRLTISVGNARALSPCFDRFHIPPGGKLFLYDPGKTRIIGAFTEMNNSSHGYFATELIRGDQFTIEYYQPAGIKGELQLHLNEILFAYRGVDFLWNSEKSSQGAGSCEVNVNCPEGQNWQFQMKGVVRISVKKGGSSFWCSGTLLNNVRQDRTPYVLTADHCGITATAEQLLQWIFYFNYEAAACQNPSVLPEPGTLTGAIKVAESGNSAFTGSDFYLVVLTQPVPGSYDAYFNGWNRQNISSPNGVGIHHPQGDLKKISTYTQPLEGAFYGSNPDYSFWKVYWDQTQSGHGVTEPGSSGSPIFDSAGRVMGTLTGGESACDSVSKTLPDFYGKFYWSWDKNGNDSTKRLLDWLDPDSTGVKFLNGLYVGISEKKNLPEFLLYPNPFVDFIDLKLASNSAQAITIEMFNLVGDRVLQTQFIQEGSESRIHCPGLPPGLYIVKVFSDNRFHCFKMIRL